MISPYLNTQDLMARYRCSSRTIFRRMKRKELPLPQPVIREKGAKNLWLAEDIENYDSQRIAAQKAADIARYFQ